LTISSFNRCGAASTGGFAAQFIPPPDPAGQFGGSFNSGGTPGAFCAAGAAAVKSTKFAGELAGCCGTVVCASAPAQANALAANPASIAIR
jgi:hypothetical protein